ncbi:Multidrug export protein MepA [compost metagenome]
MSITQGVLYIPVIILLHKFFGLHGVIWSMTVTEVITSVMGLVLFMIFSRKLKNPDQSEEIEGVPGTSPVI